MLSTLVIVFIISYLAFSLSAMVGGGAGLMLMPVLGRLLPVSFIPSALSIGTFTSSGTRILVFRKNICWAIVRYFVPAALPAVLLGAFLLKYLNPIYIEISMGLFLLSNLPFLFKNPKESLTKRTHSPLVLMLIGFSAGFLSGLTGAVGLLFNKFYLRYGLSKEEIIATRAANEVILHLIKIILYALLGLITARVVSIGLVVACSALLSTFTMKWVLPFLSEFIFQKTGYLAMVVSGLFMLIQTSKDLLLNNNGSFQANPISEGVEAKLKWQQANYSLEFTYDEGFEFEQVIPFKELSVEQQNFVISNRENAETFVIEEVHDIGKESFEVYYFNKNQLRNKLEFE